MLKKILKDMNVDPQTLKGKNENQKFRILYGPERLEFFKKNRSRFPEEYRDMNVWIKPFYGNEYIDPIEFDEIANDIKAEEARRAEERQLTAAETEEEKAERLRREELARAESQNKTPVVSGPGIQYLGADSKFRVYKITSYEGAHKFALPRSEGTGWCITGSGYWGTAPHQGPSHWRSQLNYTDGCFYFFMTTPMADSWAVWRNKGDGSLRFCLAGPDTTRSTLPSGVTLPLDVAGLEGAKINRVTKTIGPFQMNGTTLQNLTDEGMNAVELRLRADIGTVGPTAICGTRSIKEIYITSNTGKIDNRGISSNISLKEIHFAGNNMIFEDYAVADNTALIKFDFPSNSNLSRGILSGSIKLQRVTLPKSFDSIPEEAFARCNSLVKIDIPSTCTEIKQDAFIGCRNLTIYADFAERPSGWYPTIEKQVKEIVYLREKETEVEMAEEESPMEDSALKGPFVVSKIDKDYFYMNKDGYADFTYYLDYATKFDTYEEAKERLDGFQTDWEDMYKIVDLSAYNPVPEVSLDDVDDVYIEDIEPKKGEKKEDFLQRFMKETAEEYPDTKQRYAVANSYWERKSAKDDLAPMKKVIDEDYDNPEINEIENMTSEKGKRLLALMGEDCANAIVTALETNGLRNGTDYEYDIHSGWTDVSFLKDKELADKIFDATRKIVIDQANGTLAEGSGPDFDNSVLELLNIKEFHYFGNVKDNKVKDSEMVVDITADVIAKKPHAVKKEKEETVEENADTKAVVSFSVQTFVKEALDDLKQAKTNEELDAKYNNWLSKSDDLVEKGDLTFAQQDAFEDELWEVYNSINLEG